MKKKENKEESIWKAIKTAIIHIIKTETDSSLKSKMNFIFGVILFLYAIACTIKSSARHIIDSIISVLNTTEVASGSKYMSICFFLGLMLYFGFCVWFVDKDKNDKKKLK